MDAEESVRRKWRLLKATMDERARLWAGTEAGAIGYGGVATMRSARRFPYGVYDLAANDGFVSVGVDHDTPVFAVISNEVWWNRSEMHCDGLLRGRA